MIVYIGVIRAMNARLLALDICLLSCEAHVAQNMLSMHWHAIWYRDHVKQLAAIIKLMDRIGQESCL